MKQILFLLMMSSGLLQAEVTWKDNPSVKVDEELSLIYHDYVNLAYPQKVKQWIAYEENILKKPKNEGDYFRPALIKIKAGSFTMGDDSAGSQEDERHVHDVKIGYDFYIGKYEVTVLEFSKFVKATGYKSDAQKMGGCKTYKNGRQQLNPYAYWRYPYFKQDKYNPVGCLSYKDAKAYTVWLSKVTGTRYRLPSEAEWEYVARAGESREKSERDLLNYAWFNQNANLASQFVGRKKSNAWGVYDMQGNVFEWCEDLYVSDYSSVPDDGTPNKQGIAGRHVSRGGSWLNSANVLRLANRAALGTSNP
ncbi:MAG: formylglycine-generating enzyme family protein, partial [Thiovulaceae bacterium]|nr:formylglycine-generating enzyme family protein [Sulfurimonadaceae bacterium]